MAEEKKVDMIELLLRKEIPEPKTEEYKVKRLSKLWGEDFVITLKEISYSEVSDIKRMESVDMPVHIILASAVSPNFRNEELKQKYKAETPIELIKKIFSAGEIYDIARSAEMLCGYRVNTLETVKKKSE